MTNFFLLFDAPWFHQVLQTSLAEAWRGQSFVPCQDLCAGLVPAARAFRERYARREEEPLLCQVAKGLTFRRELWNLLVGEVLVHGAAEIAGVDADADTLCCLLAASPWVEDTPREQFAPIHQVLFGARDLQLGGKFYRPHGVGWNSVADVCRLAAYLAEVEPGAWQPIQLESLAALADAAEREEELELARQCFPELRELYERTARQERVIVRELL